MAQLDDKTLQNLNKRLKEMDEILASDYRKALDLGKAFTQGFSTEQIDAFLRKLGKINRADAAKLNVMFNLVDVNGKPITVQEARTRIKQITNAINKGQASTSISGTKIIGLGSMTNELKRYKDALSVLGMSTSQQFDLISRNVKRVNNEVKGLRKGFGDMIPTLQRLASAFGVAFSVRGLAQFGKKLIETRGEFERQQVALRSILQNKQLADEIWDKTMQAALQSPFTAMQLTTYTKQLAAYRIETDKLFETTKRLADVSAGLGVDMQRLILAYGQVKAANYLRASEIRQFTEAGVNVLGELRDYFNEVKGMSVDTAKVMEMVTKRLVTFEDVEAIFKRMTDAGGIFYDMQYVQSQTVRGQIAKLHDAYDQMLNNIGKANEGVLKDMVALLNNIVKNWREWKTVLDLIAWPVIIFSLRAFTRGLLSTAAAANLTTKQFTGLTGAGMKLQTTLKGLFATIKSHPWIALATAVASVVVAYRNHEKQIKAVQKEINEQNTRLYETELLLDGYQKKIEDNNKIIKNSTKGTKELTESQKDNKNILAKLQEEYPELAKGLKIQADGTILFTDLIKKYNDELERQITLSNILSQKSSSGGIGGIFSDTYKENLEQYSTSLSQLKGEILSAKHTARSIQTKMKAEGEEELPLFKILNDIADIDMSDVEEAAEKYRRIRESLWTYIVEGESEADYPTRIEKVQGADKYGFELPILSELKMSSDFAIDAIKDNRAIIESTFAESLNSIDEYSKEIAEEYGGDIQAFISDNIEKINKGVESGDADVVSTIRTVFEKNGGATTKEAKNFFNKLLNYYLVFHDAREQIDALEAQAAAERSKKVTQRNYDLIVSLEKQKQSILDSLSNREFIDFFANKPSGTNGNQTQFPDGGNGKTRENASKLISLIKEMRGEYDKLSKSAYGYAKSEEKVREAYKDSVKEILGKAGITDYDFTTNEGMIKALEKVKSYATKLGKDAAAEVQKYIDQLETEIEINAQVRIREDFGKQMEKAFGDYELTVELGKLNLPQGVAEDMFGIEETDLQKLREDLSRMYNGLRDENGQLSDEAFKDYEKFLNKIDDLERKQQRERLKDYAKYLEAQYSDRVKLEMDYVRRLAQLEAETAIPEQQKSDIRKGLEREFLEKSRKQDWEDFKGSEFYVSMMEDLEKQGSASLEVMRKKLLEMRENAENLSPRALKEVVNALEKIDELEKKRIPPLQRIREEQEKLRGIEIKDVYEKLALNQQELAQEEEKQRELERMIMLEEERQKLEQQGLTLEEAKARLARSEQALSLILPSLDTRSDGTKEGEERRRILTETVNQAKKEVETWAEIVRILSGQATIDERERGSKYKGLSLSDLKKRRDDAKQRIKDLEGIIRKDEELVKAQKDLEDAWNDTWEAAKRWAQSINGIFDGVMDTIGYFSDSTSTLTAEWKEFGDTSISALNDLVSGIQAYQQANAEAEKAGAATGLLTANGLQLAMVVLGVIIKIVQAIAKLHDARIDKEIEQSKERVDDLQKAYERLEKQIEKTFDTVSYMREFNNETQNLYEQIEEADRQIAAAQDYKNADKKKEAIEAAEEAKQEALDALDEIKQAQIETFGGIGEDGYRDAAQGFVDAWKDAFLETGDGLQGLQDHFDEFLNEWFVKQATMRVAGRMLEPLFRQIDSAVDQYSSGGANVLMQELQNVREKFGVLAPQLSEALEELAGMWGLGGEGALSGLAAGIQGMTEEQANILEAYWNSVRGYTASIDFNVARIADMMASQTGSVDFNPMLQQLNLIAANTQATHQLLQSVTKSGHSQGGYGIKVFAD